jgi:hypothetical protein
VSVLQFLLDLCGRDAAEAVRCRTGVKYALGLDLDDPGLHHGVPGGFRERLLAEGRADRLLDLALARLTEAGLVSERTTWRTGSTHVLAAVRDLTRLELVTEAVRAALEELARTPAARWSAWWTTTGAAATAALVAKCSRRRSSNSKVECQASMTALSSADPGRPIDWEMDSRWQACRNRPAVYSLP